LVGDVGDAGIKGEKGQKGDRGVQVRQYHYHSLSTVVYFSTINLLMPTVAIKGAAAKHLVPDRVKLSFVIFDIQAL